MLEFLNDNVGLFVLLLGVAVLVILVRITIQSNSLTKNLVTKKFSFENLYETDKESGAKQFTLIIANKTLNDTSITDVGFMIAGQTFSYVSEFRAQNGFVSGDKATVTQRSSLRFSVSVVELELMLFKHKRHQKIKKLRAYVVDSSGFMVSAPIRRIQKVLREDYKAMLNALRLNRIKSAKEQGKRPAFSDKIKGLFVSKKAKRTPPVLVEAVAVVTVVDKAEEKIEQIQQTIDVNKVQEEVNEN